MRDFLTINKTGNCDVVLSFFVFYMNLGGLSFCNRKRKKDLRGEEERKNAQMTGDVVADLQTQSCRFGVKGLVMGKRKEDMRVEKELEKLRKGKRLKETKRRLAGSPIFH